MFALSVPDLSMIRTLFDATPPRVAAREAWWWIRGVPGRRNEVGGLDAVAIRLPQFLAADIAPMPMCFTWLDFTTSDATRSNANLHGSTAIK